MIAAVARSTAFCDQSAGKRPVSACGKTGIGRFSRSPNSTMQNGVRLERQDHEIAQARLGGGEAAEDDGERPGEQQAEARGGQPPEGEGADRHGEGQDGADDEDRAAQAPALQGIALLDEGGGQKGEAGQADADGEPARQHRRTHGVERTLVKVMGEPERKDGQREEQQRRRRGFAGNGPDRPAPPRSARSSLASAGISPEALAALRLSLRLVPKPAAGIRQGRPRPAVSHIPLRKAPLRLSPLAGLVNSPNSQDGQSDLSGERRGPASPRLRGEGFDLRPKQAERSERG